MNFSPRLCDVCQNALHRHDPRAADVILITGTTLLNDTLDDILAAAKPGLGKDSSSAYPFASRTQVAAVAA